VNVDIAALRAIERDKDIPFETVIEAIETALLTAYKHTEGHQLHAKIDIDRKSGLVRVLARTLDE
jgi:N utilization substance protein A